MRFKRKMKHAGGMFLNQGHDRYNNNNKIPFKKKTPGKKRTHKTSVIWHQNKGTLQHLLWVDNCHLHTENQAPALKYSEEVIQALNWIFVALYT